MLPGSWSVEISATADPPISSSSAQIRHNQSSDASGSPRCPSEPTIVASRRVTTTPVWRTHHSSSGPESL